MSVNEQKSGSWSEGTLHYMGRFKWHYNLKQEFYCCLLKVRQERKDKREFYAALLE